MTSQAERRTKTAQRIQRRTDAWELRCQGWTQTRIAQQLGVTQATISRDLKWASQRALADLTAVVEQTKREQVHQLERIADEALQSWERSKANYKSVSKTVKGTRSDGEGTEESTTTKVEERAGDVRYLNTAMGALSDIRKILGADAPIAVDLEVDDLDAAIRRELARMAAQSQGGSVSEAP